MPGAGTVVTPRRVTSGRQLLGALVVLVGLATVVLWAPVRSGDYFASTDLLQTSPLLRVAPDGYRIGNRVLSDPVHQMHPWLRFNRDELRAGRLPVWNPANGGGTPHLASSVSAVLSPFSLPWYVLPVGAALVASAGLKLVLLGLFTYLFLRRLHVCHLAGLVGAVAFAFCGYNLVWLSWPHPGAAIGLVAGLWCAEVALQAATRAQARTALVGWAVALAAGLLAGHPETFFFATVLAVLYVVVRLAAARLPGRVRLRLALGFGLGGVGALGLSAVQLLPFLEYLRKSTAYAERSDAYKLDFDASLGFLHAFPGLFGSPAGRYYDPSHYGLFANFTEANGFYIGLGVLFLAAVGALSLVCRRPLPVVFFTVVPAAWVVYAYDLGGLGERIGSLPLARTGLVGRSQVVWLFSVVVLAAVGVDTLRSASPPSPSSPPSPARPTARRRRAPSPAGVAVAAGGTLTLGLALVVVRRWRADQGPAATVATAAGRAVADDHVRFVAVTFLVVVAAAVILAVAGRRARARALAGSVLIVGVFVQSGWLLRDYNPTIEERYFYPVTPALTAVRDAVGTDRVLFGSLLPPDTNLWYRLYSPDTYDGVGVLLYDRLQKHLLSRGDDRRVSRLLRTLGVGWVVSDDPHPFRLPATDPALADLRGVKVVGPLAPTARVSQRFRVGVPNLFAISVSGTPGQPGAPCSLELALEDVAARRVVARSQAPCGSSRTELRFPSLPESAGREYRAVLTGAAYYAAVAVPTPGSPGRPSADDELTADGAGTGTRLALTGLADEQVGLEPVFTEGLVTLYRVPAGPARWFSPAEAHRVESEAEALEALDSPGFDPARTVLVHGVAAESSGGPGTVRVLEESATEIRLEVRREGPGWLVALQSHYPGWEATANGRHVELHRADVAFSALPVGSGTTTVVLRYRPASVRSGLALSALSALVAAAVLLQAAIARHRGQARER